MKLKSRIVQCERKTLAGISMSMSYSNDKTKDLWHSFMLNRKRILNTKGTDLYSLQVYDISFFSEFNPVNEFRKWALVEVTNIVHLPSGIEPFILPQGLYAVFDYKGNGHDAPELFNCIFNEWLPQSGYLLDDRPHFELLGEKFKQGQKDSEEEIWIPVISKTED